MKHLFYFVLGFFLTCSSGDLFSAEKSSWQQEVESIDKQIDELKELKRGYEGKMLRHENQAELLQFKQGELPTARKHWMLAEENRSIAEKIQQDIDQLEKRKRDLLEEHCGEK